MLIVPAFKFGNPMMLIVLVEANDATIHGSLRVLTVKLPVSVLLPRFWKETSSPGCPGSAKLAR